MAKLSKRRVILKLVSKIPKATVFLLFFWSERCWYYNISAFLEKTHAFYFDRNTIWINVILTRFMSSRTELPYEIIWFSNKKVKKDYKDWKTLKNESNLRFIKISGARNDGLFDVPLISKVSRFFDGTSSEFGASLWNETFQIRPVLDYKSKYLVNKNSNLSWDENNF